MAGLRYDPLAVPDLAAVLCPPYDIIDADQRRLLAGRDARNAVHVELPVEDPASGADRYQHAALLFDEWRAKGLLRRDAPSVYVYEQAWAPAGQDDARPLVARGIFCALRLEQPGAGVRRHEQTMAAPKEDRLRLLRAVRANLSPVLLLYGDEAGGRRSAGLIDDAVAGRSPVAEATTDDGTRHRLWAIGGDWAQAKALLALAGERPLTIADGHHRYETALRYRDEIAATGSGTEAASWVLALLYDAASGGLALLPTHRLLHGLGAGAPSLLDALDGLYEISPLADGAAVARAVAAQGAGTLGVWTAGGGGLLAGRHAALEPLLPAASAALRELDVTALGAALERILGADAATLADSGRLSYTKDAAEALAQVGDGRADACLLLAPTPIEAVMAVAGAGELMPPKSTYFVPKAATGLVFNSLEAE